MKLGLAAVAFFLSFFRIELIYPGFFLSAFVGLAGIYYVLRPSGQRVLRESVPRSALVCLGAVAVIAVVQDGFGPDAGIGSNSFAVRIASVVLLSFLAALFVSEYYLRGQWDRLTRVIQLCFWVQLGFWVVTYVSPVAKELAYVITARPDSVNLYRWNMSSRGFGLSKEVNFGSPYMMIFCSLIIARDKILSVVTIPTQLINSNLAAVAIVLGVLLTRLKGYQKAMIMTPTILGILYFGDAVFRRFYGEFMGGGSRTVQSLTRDHLFVLNEGLFEHLFGAGLYVFQTGGRYSSDVGWVIMYNYGGLLFCAFFVILLYACTIRALGLGHLGLAFFISGLVLNSKGLLFGPNSFWFVLFVVIFTVCRQRLRADSASVPGRVERRRRRPRRDLRPRGDARAASVGR